MNGWSRLLRALAIVSALAGAVVSLLPAVVIALVNLFYNSAGGVLILLGSLISLLPFPAGAGTGGSSHLPYFQTLGSSVLLVAARSVGATGLCCLGFALLVGGGRRPAWPAIIACCAGAALLGGTDTAVAVAPAAAASAVTWAFCRSRLS